MLAYSTRLLAAYLALGGARPQPTLDARLREPAYRCDCFTHHAALGPRAAADFTSRIDVAMELGR